MERDTAILNTVNTVVEDNDIFLQTILTPGHQQATAQGWELHHCSLARGGGALPGLVHNNVSNSNSKISKSDMDKVMKMQIALFQTNKYYSSHEEYVGALATQLETEYRKGDDRGS